jgi:hypothetical protein
LWQTLFIVLIVLAIFLALPNLIGSRPRTAWTTLRPNFDSRRTIKSLTDEGWKPDSFVVVGDSLTMNYCIVVCSCDIPEPKETKAYLSTTDNPTPVEVKGYPVFCNKCGGIIPTDKK